MYKRTLFFFLSLFLCAVISQAQGDEKQTIVYSAARANYTFALYAGADVSLPVDADVQPGNSYEIAFEAPADGLYEIHLSYKNITQSILPTEISVKLDGEYPFTEAKNIQLRSLWVDDGIFPVDRYNNELSTIPHPSDTVLSTGFSDSTARTLAPFLFELSAGQHLLSLTVIDGESHIVSLSLKAQKEAPAYVAGSADGNQIIVIEGEKISSRNSSSIRGASEYTPTLSPYSVDRRLINHLSGASFYQAGDIVTYDFDVPETGWYSFGSFYRQNTRQDCAVFADILIDGALPFDKAAAVAFDYTTDFSYMKAEKDEETLTFYLEKGQHSLSLRLNAEQLTPAFELIEKMINEINALSQQITRLSGGMTSDKYRYYNVLGSIPDVVDTLNGWADELNNMLSSLSALAQDGKTTAFSYFELAAKQLKRLSLEPENLPRRLDELSTGSNSVAQMLAQQLLDLSYNCLSIDQIYIYQTGASFPEKAGWLESATLNAKRFFNSFSAQDYSASSGQTGHLQVWMGENRQLVELLQNLIDAYFTPETGIEVDLSMMTNESKLVLSNAAGTSPDVALSVGFVTPSYLDVREALYDLTQFEDFPEIAQRFSSNLFVPYIYDENVYAMPQQILFWVLYYRSDILASLGLQVPDTLEDVRLMLPELQAQGMNFYYPTAGMSGTKSFAGTLPLILQNGGSIYGDTVGNTMLDTETSLKGFKELTDLFTVYSLPIDVGTGFYQRFRDGTLPIGINELGMYNLLNNTAPELNGKWNIALIPGVAKEDGTVSRYTTGNMKAMMIMANTDMPNEAWEFLKWWSSTEVQSMYANQLFTTFGEDCLWTSANTEAFSLLPIKQEHKQVILTQMNWMLDAPWCLGTYMVERELSNAFLSVVVDGTDARRALDKAVKRINRETFRKLEEFGYYKDGVMVKEYLTPTGTLIDRMIEEYNAKKEEKK